MQFHNVKEKVLIIDFGSQVTKLIARRVRDLGIFSEIITPKEIKRVKDFNSIRGIILSGGPSTVTKEKFERVPIEIFSKKIPILGICYGLQLIAKLYGGKIKSSKRKREFGRAFIFKKRHSELTKNFFKNKSSVWMSHEDAVVKLPKKFIVSQFKTGSDTISSSTVSEIQPQNIIEEISIGRKCDILFLAGGIGNYFFFLGIFTVKQYCDFKYFFYTLTAETLPKFY
mgnify:CR=1 FL=1